MQLRGSVIFFMDSKFYGHRNLDALKEIALYFHKILCNSRNGVWECLWRRVLYQDFYNIVRFKHRNLFVVDVDKTTFEQARLSFYRRDFDDTDGTLADIVKLDLLPAASAVPVVDPTKKVQSQYYIIAYAGNECYYFENHDDMAFDLSNNTANEKFNFAKCLIESGMTNKRVFFTIQTFFGRERTKEILKAGAMTFGEFKSYLCFLYKKYHVPFYLFCADDTDTKIVYSIILGDENHAKKFKLTKSVLVTPAAGGSVANPPTTTTLSIAYCPGEKLAKHMRNVDSPTDNFDNWLVIGK